MLNATVIKRIDITPELIIMHIRPDAGVGDFLPGQYVALGLLGSAPRSRVLPPEREPSNPEKMIKRAYSIGSSPLQKDHLEFYFAVVPDGALTSRLAALKEGDKLFCANKITGTFTLSEVPKEKNLVFVSTGTGIAPFISMIRTPSTWDNFGKIKLIHGVRYEKDFAYRSELLSLKERESRFEYLPIVSREEWKGQKGHVQKFFTDGTITLSPENDHVFICGNPSMTNDIETLLGKSGYLVHSKKTPGSLHIEKYW